MIRPIDLLNGAEQDLDDGYGAAACSFRNAARDALAPFNLERHTLVVVEQGCLKVRNRAGYAKAEGTAAGVESRFFWEITPSERPVVQAIYAVGSALELLPQPVLDKLLGTIL